ncbi:PIN domain-containing protein [Methanolobus sp. WCC1]|uniref:PIN domain-containing protein n=1 Tax=unclassified Methanolobus TaxID=2629569 RepID=UPI00324EA1EC
MIDTNIFVYREDYKKLTIDLQKMLCILNKLHAELMIHPRSIEDIERDNDEERKSIILSKIKSYPFLESAPEIKNDSCFIEIIGSPAKINDDIDNSILYALYKNSVDFLITNDKGIHKKAKKLGINSHVLDVKSAYELFKKELAIEYPIILPALKNEQVFNLDITDPFFDSLKKEYSGFEDWFIKISRSGRKCYVHYEEKDKIGALLIYKIEDETLDSTPVMPKKKRLKLSTFKVSHVGNKIGELFIKLAVNYARSNNLNELYLTHHIDGNIDYLVELIKNFGFEKKATLNSTGEAIFIKKLEVSDESISHLNPIEISKTFYPTFYDGENVNKFIIPIRPKWHEKLFTDYNRTRVGNEPKKGRLTTLNEFAGQFVIEGNTIKKSYICHSTSKKITAGDILLFYRSGDEKAITSLGVVENIYQGHQSPDEIAQLVGKISVYSDSEIEKLSHKSTLVILFRFHFHLPDQLNYVKLKEWEVLKGPPQRLMKISHDKYLIVKEQGRIDERFTID